jgi:hypothetical protein
MVSQTASGVIGWIAIEPRPSARAVGWHEMSTQETLAEALSSMAVIGPIAGGRHRGARYVRPCHLARPAACLLADLAALERELERALVDARRRAAAHA